MKTIGYLVAVLAFAAVASVACLGDKSSQEQASDILNRGLQAHADGRIDDAAAAYREVLQKDPQNKYAYYNLGLIEQTAGRDPTAENNYRLSLNVDPDYVPALYNLAILRTHLGSMAEAMDIYRHVLKLDDANSKTHYNLGLLLRAAGEQIAGDVEIAKARQLDPTLPPPPPVSPVTDTPVAGATPANTPAG